MAENDAVAAFGVAPGDRTRFIANHVAGAAFETLLIVEQDAAIIGGHEQFCGARPHAGLGGAAFANLSVDGDVRGVRNTKIDRFHAIVEAQRCLRSLMQKRGYRHVSNLEPRPRYVEPCMIVGIAVLPRYGCRGLVGWLPRFGWLWLWLWLCGFWVGSTARLS